MADALGRLRSFLGELQRRKVYQVAAVYLVAAFVGLQALDLLVPATTLPGWATQLFIALAVLGFPIALVLAWAFEVTPEGVRLTSAREEERGRGIAERRPVRERSRAVTDRSIAVLPFETLGAEKASAFTDAVHGDVLTRLSSISDLCVISRTSVLPYRRAEKPLPVIADELGVVWVLGGEVQEIGDRVQVNARLVDAREDRQVWAESYRRELTAENLFQIQSEITSRIIRALQARLTRQEEQALVTTPTGNLEAYRLHAQGRDLLDRRTEESMRGAAESFRRALAEDPGYALAWVGLADALTLLFDYGHDPADAVLPEAEAAVRRAFELDPQLAEAHASLGILHSNRNEGPEAIRELQRAIELRPGYAEAHNWLSWVYQLVGAPERALQSAKRAVERNPLSPEAVSNLAISHLINGEAETARQEARRAHQLEPEWTTPTFYEALALYDLGRFAEAAQLLRELPVEWAGSGSRASLALALAAAGEADAAARILLEFEEAGDDFAAGVIYVALGDPERAFEAFLANSDWSNWPSLTVHHYYPALLAPLRADPRWSEVARSARRAWGMDRAGVLTR